MPSIMVLGMGRNEIGIRLTLLLNRSVERGKHRIRGVRNRMRGRNRVLRRLCLFEVDRRGILASGSLRELGRR